MELWSGRRGRLGIAVAALLIGGCGLRSTAAELYPQLAEHEGARIDDVRVENTDPFREDTLLALLETRPSRCNFFGVPVCVPFTRLGREEHFFNLGRVHADVETLRQFYRITGYFGTRVTPTVQEDGRNVDVTFTIIRGEPIVLDEFTVAGTEGILDPDSLTRQLPLQPGEIFHLGRFLASSDTILRALQRRGHMYAEMLRSFTVDTVDKRAEAALEVLPGPSVVVDTIIVQGATNLGRGTALRQLEFREGDVLRSSQLIQSQRNLYGLELVSLASVTVAPDSLQVAPADSTRGTVLVSVVEAPVNEIEAAVGFGTVECLRTDVQWVNRSFRGGARRLALRGSVSRLGVGDPFAVDFGEEICRAFQADTAFGGTQFDYRLAADFTQPYFLGPRNQLTLNVFGERTSEPGIFQREALGGRVGVARRMSLRSTLGLGAEVEHGATRASPALFCVAFQVCEPAIIDSLQGRRFRTELGASYFHDQTNNRLDPSDGRVLRSTLSWAPAWLGSEVRFLRWTGDGSLYRRIGARHVAAVSLRLGNFFRTIGLDPAGGFLPPEERFYAGGATTVRGFDRNALGPGVYTTQTIEVTEAGDTLPAGDARFVPTGGTALVVLSTELRMPSPVLSDLLRWVVFVDAGSIGAASLWDLELIDLKMTPGAGARLQTPVGPVRVDVAYNPHRRPAGPLLWADLEGSGVIRRVNEDYRPATGGFFSRLRVHLGIGHAF